MHNDLLAYKAIESDEKQSNKIAWVIGIVLAFIVLAIVWATMNRNQNEANNRATDFAVNMSNRVGALENNQVVIGEITRTTTGNVSDLIRRESANRAIVGSQGRVLDELAVITANTGNGSCGDSYGIPRFRRTNEYQLCSTRLFENDTCGNANG